MRVDSITHVDVTGIASIDGPVAFNNRLAMGRAKAMTKWILTETEVPGDIIKTASKGEDWILFRKLVEQDPAIPSWQDLLRIIDSEKDINDKERLIRALGTGTTWRYLVAHIFPLMRCAEVVIDFKHRYLVQLPEEKTLTVDDNTSEIETIEDTEAIVVEETPEVELFNEDMWRRRMYIKTDLPYWLLTWANVAFEIDLGRHWSLNIPVTYSAVNYFKHTIKFRNFSLQPGIRYWLRGNNQGVYFEAHYGVAWYDFAFGGKYRYQDYYRKTPAQGGGIAAGYRMPISKNGRWSMEFGGGIGAYRLHYNRFQNRHNGKLIDSKKKTYLGLDNINVSISYSFPIEKRKESER